MAGITAETLCSQGFRYKGLTRGERASGFFVEKALSHLLPSDKEMPFAVRVDMDILSDDGGAVETALNSAALALGNARVPLLAPVAGVCHPRLGFFLPCLALLSSVQKPQLCQTSLSFAWRQ